MQIIQEKNLRHIQIDAAKIKQFLLQQGLTERDIDILRIHVQYAPSQKQKGDIVAQGDGEEAWGLYYGPCDVYLFTNKRPVAMASSLNKTLLHELRHHIQNGYQPEEERLPHKERPSEIDAYAFASEHAGAHVLLTIPGETGSTTFTPLEDTLMQILAIELVVCGLLALKVFAGIQGRRIAK